MRVLHLHSGNMYGGIERALATLARHGLGEGTTQTFALCFEGRFSNELRETGAAIALLGAVRASRPASVAAARRRLRQWLAENRTDVVVTHLPWTQAVLGPVAAEASCPCVQWIHGPIEGWIARWARLSMPSSLICNSTFTARSLPAPFRRLPATVIHYPLDVVPADRDTRAATRLSMRTLSSDVVVVQASRFERWKGHEVLVRALSRLAQVPGWVLWIVGGAQRPSETAYERELRALITECGLSERCRFAGEQPDVSAYLSAADVYCQPNLGPEPFGLVYVEALAAGLPVIASNTGALPEIVDETTGILVDPGDITALTRALEGLLVDGTMRGRLGDAGPARAAALCEPRRQLELVAAYLTSAATQPAGTL